MDMSKKVLIFGGLGAASSLAMMMIDAYKRGQTKYKFCGYINDKDGVSSVQEHPVLGGKKDVPRLLDEGYYFLNTIYKIDGMIERVKMFESLNIPDDRLATFVHPSAYVAENVELSPGCVIMPFATVSSAAKLGKCCRVSLNATLGHDTTLGNHTFLAANSVVGSHVEVGEAVYFGLNCTVNGKLNIGSYSVVGIGSVLTKNAQNFEIWAGNPAKIMRKTKDSTILD